LIAADVFRSADQNRQRLTYGDVERWLAQLAMHPPDCTCGKCWMTSKVTALMTLIESARSCSVKLLTGDGVLTVVVLGGWRGGRGR
jgi:hypothetical protein